MNVGLRFRFTQPTGSLLSLLIPLLAITYLAVVYGVLLLETQQPISRLGGGDETQQPISRLGGGEETQHLRLRNNNECWVTLSLHPTYGITTS